MAANKPKTRSPSPRRALKRAVRLIGSQSKVAQVVKVSQPSVWFILANKSKCPAEWCIPIEIATGGQVSRYDLRPDLYPREGNFAVTARRGKTVVRSVSV